jgi:uncharacterized membrane protein
LVFLGYIGAMLLIIVAAALHIGGTGWRVFPWIVAALLLYVVVFVVTGAMNIPLNDALAAAKTADPTAARHAFESAWVGWNLVRTIVNTLAFGCLTWALVLSGRTN